MTDIHASPPPFEFDFLLSPKDDMSHSGDQGSIKIEEVREREKEQEDGGDGDVSMTTGMFPSSPSPAFFSSIFTHSISLPTASVSCSWTMDDLLSYDSADNRFQYIPTPKPQ